VVSGEYHLLDSRLQAAKGYTEEYYKTNHLLGGSDAPPHPKLHDLGTKKINVAHIRQSTPDSGHGFEAEVLNTFMFFLSLGGPKPTNTQHLTPNKNQRVGVGGHAQCVQFRGRASCPGC